jgi:hypothetical protein
MVLGAIAALKVPDPRCPVLLEFSSAKPGLSDDGMQGPDADFIVVRNRYGDGGRRKFFLHDNVASTLSHFLKTVSCENIEHLFAG